MRSLDYGLKAAVNHRAIRLNSALWARMRIVVLRANPVCVCCNAELANEVDHIDGNASNNSPANLQALCKPCHSRKTALEVAARAR